jgi:hypothetical protein
MSPTILPKEIEDFRQARADVKLSALQPGRRSADVNESTANTPSVDPV